jgi:hypothetical protein
MKKENDIINKISAKISGIPRQMFKEYPGLYASTLKMTNFNPQMQEHEQWRE